MLLHDFFGYHVRTAPDRPCILDGERRLSYLEVDRESNRLVNALRSEGLRPGDRFAWLSRNSADMVVGYLAASKSGFTMLPLNWRLAPVEWRGILEQGGARLVVAQQEFIARFDEARPVELRACFVIGEPASGWRDYRDWLAGQSDHVSSLADDEGAALYQMYTSGTTGTPKGAVLTQRSVISNVIQALLVFEKRLSPADCTLIVMPMFHAGAASFVIGSLISGATMLIQREFEPHAFVAALSGGVTMANVVPAMLQMALTQVPDIAERDYSRLHTIIYGASPIAEETLRRALQVFRCQFYQGYGQTEASATLTFLTHADHQRALTEHAELLLSAGRPIAGTCIRIVDNQGRDVPTGKIGEIVVRGPQIMQGYWNRPDETAAAFYDGWLRSGDAGKLDAEGYLYICDRVKDMIISGGENIYPREVENVLFAHPAVADVAVIGVPDATYGEAVMAVIVPKAAATLSLDDVVAHCRRQLAGYKIPRHIELVSELPRNPSGKVLKNVLREPYWRDRKRRVS